MAAKSAAGKGKMEKRRDYIEFIASMLIFGTNGLLVMHISLTSAQIVLTRTFLGSIFLLFVMLAKHELSFSQYRQDALPVMISGICLGANWVFLFEAYRYASVSIGTLLYYCGPMIVMALSPLLFHEKLSWNKIAAIAAVAAGMICITGIAGAQTLSARGLMNGLAAALLYAGLIISNKRIRHVSGLASTFAQLVIAFCVILIYLLLRGGLPFGIASGSELACILVLGIVNTGIACWFYFSSMQRLPGQTVALCCYVDPLSAVLFSALFLGERLNVLEGIGAVLILGGALLGEWKQKSHNFNPAGTCKRIG